VSDEALQGKVYFQILPESKTVPVLIFFQGRNIFGCHYLFGIAQGGAKAKARLKQVTQQREKRKPEEHRITIGFPSQSPIK
jgi:hypothetical protein